MNKLTTNIPSIRALIALERVAHLGNVTRAAEALNTSQAAVSRHIRQLENDLGVSLIRKDGRGIAMTQTGERYVKEVTAALQQLRNAQLRATNSNRNLTIACSHEVSHLILMPRYNALKQALGDNSHIRILTCEYGAIPDMIAEGADIVFEYHDKRPLAPCAGILKEEIVPAASPDFLAEYGEMLNSSPDQWNGIVRLSLTKENSGWATWEDWFQSQEAGIPKAPEQMFDNYVYALEAATRGEGVVLAWRGFADPYLKAGQLNAIRPHWTGFDTRLYAVQTPNAMSKKLARKCINFFSTR